MRFIPFVLVMFFEAIYYLATGLFLHAVAIEQFAILMHASH